MQFVFSKFSDFLKERIDAIPINLLYFLIGLIAGIILFVIVFLTLLIISKKKISRTKTKHEVVVNPEYRIIIQQQEEFYINNYEKESIINKTKGMGKIIVNLLDGISSIYYPKSEDPIFEITITQLVDFLDYAIGRLDKTFDDLLENRLHAIDRATKYTLKDKKISTVVEMITPKQKPDVVELSRNGLVSFIKEKTIEVGKKIALKIGGSIANKEFEELIEVFGEDINKLYSGQELIFQETSDRKIRENKIKSKKMRGKRK